MEAVIIAKLQNRAQPQGRTCAAAVKAILTAATDGEAVEKTPTMAEAGKIIAEGRQKYACAVAVIGDNFCGRTG
ncbi:MAG TPA: hypothetical protein IGS52_00835 [Oscillatoriaceae cyanobacterium M33_DOE_052]|uniref:Uncharacterized protein n=1 Tax=Planktothricoides sp. SpSt-374 TaxID=2282167 RepID=A0A7C3VM85_9CYAN|nr:hypothetical protein [Oscillatoriaceae cyanobacterium M33_DOE_052]